MKHSIGYILLVLGILPIFLFVFNPAWQLGGLGLFLGFWGMFISTILIFVLIFMIGLNVYKKAKNRE